MKTKYIFYFLFFASGIIIGEKQLINYFKSEAKYFFSNLNKKKDDQLLDVEKISLRIDSASLKKIIKKRNIALQKGLNLRTKKDYFPFEMDWHGEKMLGELRLKGKFKDHFDDEKKMSFKIKLNGNQKVMGMNFFSLQHPKTRNYLAEWIFQEFLKFNNLNFIKYDFVKVNLNNENVGIFAIEEGFSGDMTIGHFPVLKFSEDELFQKHKISTKFYPNIPWIPFVNNEYLNAEIKVYKNKSGYDSNNKYRGIAFNKLNRYRRNELSASETFDPDIMGKFIAIIDLFSAHHALSWNNLRFILNPSNSMLEPVGYDAYSEYHENKSIFNKDLSMDVNSKLFFVKNLFNDTIFFKSYIKNINAIANSDSLKDFFNEITNKFNLKKEILLSEFKHKPIDFNIYYSKAKLIQTELRNAEISQLNYCARDSSLVIYNSTRFPMQILRIENNNETIYTFNKENFLKAKLFLEPTKRLKLKVSNTNLPFKNKKLKLIYKVYGGLENKTKKINSFFCD